jgi:anti-sigma28 factor (negative regulator of flagellin synthesis)
MNVNNSLTTSSNSAELITNQPLQTAPTSRAGNVSSDGAVAGGANSNDDVHLSELVRSLRALAGDSPERQAKIENLARAYANGNYSADSQSTADGIISDAISHTSSLQAA